MFVNVPEEMGASSEYWVVCFALAGKAVEGGEVIW
jgi:hypothetical protein